MIDYKTHTLGNGLRVIAHRDPSTPMAAVNLLYRVGARNEEYEHTGFAHLFEHLMFGGSRNVPEYDTPVQLAGGENNAFTNNDYTNYYLALPRENLETALWIESDRMMALSFTSKSLDVQRKVVIEEFSQRYLNQPYGDLWLLLRPLAYETHPYRWATIGRTPDHIQGATMAQVKAFWERFYGPENAILSIGADLPHHEIFSLAAKWFGDIPRRTSSPSTSGHTPVYDTTASGAPIPAEPEQREPRRLVVTRDVPASVIYLAFHTGGRRERETTVCDCISDLLSNGTSSRLYQRLVKRDQLFSSVNAYISGDADPGLFLVTGRIMEGRTPEEAEAALWAELDLLKREAPSDYEMEKVKNKFEATHLFAETNVMNKAMNLAYYEMLGSAGLINSEVAEYASVTTDEVMQAAARVFRPGNCSTLWYLSGASARRDSL